MAESTILQEKYLYEEGDVEVLSLEEDDNGIAKVWDVSIEDDEQIKIVETLEEFILFLRSAEMTLKEFMQLPVAQYIPESLQEEIEQTRHLAGQHDQSTHGRGNAYRFPDNGTQEDAEQLAEEWKEKWVSKLEVLEKGDISHYGGMGSSNINNYLREGGNSNDNRAVMSITNALNKFSLDKDHIVYRGGLFGNDFADKLQVGSIINEKGFMSTSLLSVVGERYAGKGFSGTKAVFFEITLPKGSKAAFIPSITSQWGEMEMLVQRGSSIRIKDIIKNGNNYNVLAELVQ